MVAVFVESDGAAAVTVIAALDGVQQAGAVSNGATTVSVSPSGVAYAVAVESDGVAAVVVTSAGRLTSGLITSNGVGYASALYAPDLSDNEPIGMALTFTAVAVLIPPDPS